MNEWLTSSDVQKLWRGGICKAHWSKFDSILAMASHQNAVSFFHRAWTIAPRDARAADRDTSRSSRMTEGSFWKYASNAASVRDSLTSQETKLREDSSAMRVGAEGSACAMANGWRPQAARTIWS